MKSSPERGRLRLLCFPYAGGSATVFRHWARFLRELEVFPITLPGRAQRVKEPLIDRLDVLVRSLADEVAPLVDRPFALFGHSLGALVAFELASFLEADRRRVPEHLFVSACQAPSHLSDSRRHCHTLPDTEFRKHLRSIRGTSAEVFRNDDLMEMFVPILRADFKLLETYQLPRERPRLSCPITAIGGLDDLKDIPAHAIQLWEAHTAGRFARYMLPGDHFFIHAYEQHLMEVIVEELSGMQRGGALSLP